MRRIADLPGLAALAALLATLAGCNQDGAARPAAAGKLVRFINTAECRSLDPHRTSWMQDIRVIDGLFEGLLTLNPKTLEPQEGVAYYPPKISPDRTVYTFTLRPDATWSNGDPVTAQDFVWSWQRAMDPATGADYVQFFFYLAGGEAYFTAMEKFYAGQGERPSFDTVGVKALDARTLQVTLRAPVPFFLDLVAFTPLYPVHRPTLEKFARTIGPGKIEYDAAWWKPENLVGNGPFTLERWDDRVQMVLRRRAGYWDTVNVPSERIQILPIPGESERFTAYDAGLADILPAKAPRNVMDELMRQRRDGRRADVHPFPVFATYFYRINCTRPPFTDVRVRQALNLSIDRELIANQVKGHGERASGLLVPAGTGSYAGPESPALDVPRARALLADAGFPDGKGFPQVTLLFRSDGGHLDVAEAIKAMWLKNLNIEIKLQQVEPTVIRERIKKIDYDLVWSNWYGDYFDPLTFLEMFVTQSGPGGNNDTGWSDPRYDRLIQQASVEPDTARRNAQLREAETILCLEQVPILCWYTMADCMMFDPAKVGGVYPNARMYNPFKSMHVK